MPVAERGLTPIWGLRRSIVAIPWWRLRRFVTATHIAAASGGPRENAFAISVDACVVWPCVTGGCRSDRNHRDDRRVYAQLGGHRVRHRVHRRRIFYGRLYRHLTRFSLRLQLRQP